MYTYGIPIKPLDLDPFVTGDAANHQETHRRDSRAEGRGGETMGNYEIYIVIHWEYMGIYLYVYIYIYIKLHT